MTQRASGGYRENDSLFISKIPCPLPSDGVYLYLPSKNVITYCIMWERNS